ncbi:MAG: hypothetical protein BIFFINMI_02968 [Phycisphaerae bacterium]|nr:hypothetical protein [Phycisphaerae bacterium]
MAAPCRIRVPGVGDVEVGVSIRLALRRRDGDATLAVTVPPMLMQLVEFPQSAGLATVWLDRRDEPGGAIAFALRCEARLADGWALYDAALQFDAPAAGWRLVLPSGWGRELDPIPDALDWTGNYPGWSACSQLMVLQSSSGGLSVSARDAELELKFFRASRHGDRVRLQVVRVPEWRGGAWRVDGPCEILLAPHAGGWDAAAADYRRRQEQIRPALATPRPMHPLLAVDPVWLTQNCFCYPPDEVEDTVALAAEWACPVIVHFYNWQNGGFDTRYPNWVGVRERAVGQFRALAAAGIPAIPYINGRVWDTTTDSYAAVGRPTTVLNVAGKREVETYATSNYIELAVTCPAQRAHHAKVREVATHLAEAGFGLPGVYVDQLGAAFGLRCYADRHGHPPGGAASWPAGQREMVAGVREDFARVIGCEPILAIENASEVLVDQVDAFLYFCGRPDESLGRPVPLWHAIYGDMASSFADNFNFSKEGALSDGRPAAGMMARLARQAVFGSQLGWLSPRLLTGDYAAAGALVCRARAARLPLLPLIRGRGFCADLLDSTAERTGVFLSAWRDVDRTVALAVNPSCDPVAFAWPDGQRARLDPCAAASRRLT